MSRFRILFSIPLGAFLLLGLLVQTPVAAASDRPDEVLSWRHRILPRDEYARLAGEWEAYVRAHPGDARAMVEWGDALRYSGERAKAREAYVRAFQTDSSAAAAVVAAYVSEILLSDVEKADWDLGRERLLRAAKLEPDYPDTYYTLWVTALQAGDRDLVRHCLVRMIETGDMPRPLVDLGYNMLIGAPEGAIVFTNGDNDTYPPLAVQAMLGIRPDVSIVNLSLLNIRWYVRAMRDAGVPIGLSDAQIDALKTGKDNTISMQVQRSIYAALGGTRPSRPLYYAVTVPPSNRVLPGEPILRGLLEEIPLPAHTMATSRDLDFDPDGIRELIDTAYRFDSITDPLVDWDRESVIPRLAMNYVALLTRVGEWLYGMEPRTDEGGPYLAKAISILAFHDKKDDAREILQTWEKADPKSSLLAKTRKLLE